MTDPVRRGAPSPLLPHPTQPSISRNNADNANWRSELKLRARRPVGRPRKDGLLSPIQTRVITEDTIADIVHSNLEGATPPGYENLPPEYRDDLDALIRLEEDIRITRVAWHSANKRHGDYARLMTIVEKLEARRLAISVILKDAMGVGVNNPPPDVGLTMEHALVRMANILEYIERSIGTQDDLYWSVIHDQLFQHLKNAKSFVDRMDYRRRIPYRTSKKRWYRLRNAVWSRDNYTCVECGATKEDSRLEVDHIIPPEDGGDPFPPMSGLQTLCIPCHRRKTERDRKARDAAKVREDWDLFRHDVE